MSEITKVDLFDLEALSNEGFSDLSNPLFQEDEDEAADGEKYIVFQINEDNYAIQSELVAEVVRMLPFTELPNLPPWFVGISNLRGDIVSIIDLPAIWKEENSVATQKAKLIVMRSENSDSNIAFRVDRLREIVILPEDAINSAKSKEKHLLGVAEYKSLPLKVLDATEVISSLSLR